MTSSFAKENSQRSTHYVIEAHYVKDAFHKLNVPFYPALNYIVSYSFLTIKWPCTDPFWKRSQILFLVVQVDMQDGALDETAIP